MIVYKGKRFNKKADPSKFYISKEDFLNELIEYKKTGVVSNELGKMFLLLSKKLASARNFSSYPFIDEWIQEGVLTCLKYMHNFNPENAAKNPFGYFTMYIKNTFLVMIKKEKTHLELKKKLYKYDENGYIIDENNINEEFVEEEPYHQ